MTGVHGRYRHFVEGERLFDAPPSAVWEVLSDFQGVATWAPPITSVTDIGASPRGIGAARRCKIRGLGTVDEFVTTWEEGKRLGYRVTPLGPIGASESLWDLEPAGEGTLVKLRLDYDTRLGPFGALIHTLVARRVLVRALPGALATLRRRVRTGPMARPLHGKAKVE